MNHEFRAEQQVARERLNQVTRYNRYRQRLSYFLATTGVLTVFFLLLTRGPA